MKNLNQMIDHTLLKQDATTHDIAKLCEEAIKYQFKTVCLNPCHVKTAHEILHKLSPKGESVGICTVIGFPLGATFSSAKSFETKLSIDSGANEIDMVINIGALKANDLKYVTEDIASVVEAASGRTVKVIIESYLLTEEEIIKACECAQKGRAHFVKTSTGFVPNGGATLEAVRLMKETVGESMEVKASGGIRNAETAKAMIEAGASRLGTSQSLDIIKG